MLVYYLFSVNSSWALAVVSSGIQLGLGVVACTGSFCISLRILIDSPAFQKKNEL